MYLAEDKFAGSLPCKLCRSVTAALEGAYWGLCVCGTQNEFNGTLS